MAKKRGFWKKFGRGALSAAASASPVPITIPGTSSIQRVSDEDLRRIEIAVEEGVFRALMRFDRMQADENSDSARSESP